MKKQIVILATILILSLTACGDSKAAKEARLEGITALNEGRLTEAIASFDEALSYGDGIVDTFEIDLLKYRGEAEYRIGDFASAAKTYDTLFLVDGGKQEYADLKATAEMEAKNKEAVELLASGHAEQALALLEEGLSLTTMPDLTKTLLYNKGACLEALGRFDEAYRLFQDYVSAYGSDAAIERELTFLSTRV